MNARRSIGAMSIAAHCQPPAEKDVGSIGVVVLAVALAWALAMGLALGPVVRHLADRQHAQSAADAAALAAVLKDCGSAGELAAANQANLVSCARQPATGGTGYEAVVEVVIGTTSATARASNGP